MPDGALRRAMIVASTSRRPTGYRDAFPQNYVAYGLNVTCTRRL
jgi:hypothetical protein